MDMRMQNECDVKRINELTDVNYMNRYPNDFQSSFEIIVMNNSVNFLYMYAYNYLKYFFH